MDYQMLKRRELQALCKLNNIPANLTNAAMSDALSNLPSVEGLEEFLRDPAATDCESPERSVITSSGAPRTSARPKVTQEGIEGSKLGTRTRYGTRSRAVEGTDTRKTPATRTTRRKASQEATAQKQSEKHLQADFEADMEQSDVSDNSCLLGEMKEISEVVSGVGETGENQSSLAIQNDSKNPENFDVHKVFDVCDNKENLQNKDAVIEDQNEPSEVTQNGQKVDFHSLSRRDLQSLCKKNKIPANTTNATMADALESLDIVEGLEEFLTERSSQAPHSPTPSEMTSSCARRTWTSRRITKEPTSSKLVTKSCRGSRRKVDIVQEETAVSETSEASTIVCSMESAQKNEVLTYSRSGSIKKAADQSAGLEYTAETSSGEGRLSMVEGLAISQCQLEATEMEKPIVTFSVSDTSNSNNLTKEHAVENKFGETDDCVINDNEKGNYGLLNTENDKQLGDPESKTDADIVDHISMVNDVDGNVQTESIASGSDDTEVFTDETEFETDSGDIQIDNVNESEIAEGSEDSEISSEAGLVSRSGNMASQNVDICLVEKLEGAQEDQVSEKYDLEFEFQNVDSCLVEKLEGAQEEYQVFEKLDLEFQFQNVDSIEKLEGAQEEDQVSEKLDLEFTAEQIENSHKEEEENTSLNYAALISHSNEEHEASYTLNEISKDSESYIQTTVGKETPLANKSLRILKKLLKEKLQATTLAKEMENLTLKENDDPLTSGVNDAPISAVVPKDTTAAKQAHNEDLEDVTEPIDVKLADNFDVDALNLYLVNTLLDNLISEDSVTGRINVDCDQELSSEKHLSMTPRKMMPVVSSPTKTPMSEVNKENIDCSSNRTESAKISDARSGLVGSTMSIGKLKKALQQHSGMKRPALQVRSENCLPLASP